MILVSQKLHWQDKAVDVGCNPTASPHMNKVILRISFIIHAFALLSCGNMGQAGANKYDSNVSRTTGKDSLQPANKRATFKWETPEKLTVFAFLERVEIDNQNKDSLMFMTMTDDFPKNWIKASQIDTLINLVNSKQRCLCFVNPLSSYIPFEDSADLGGYAIELIKAYKNRKTVSFGLNSCPKTNERDAQTLIEWWSKQMK